MAEIAKTEEQIAKDKEAVKAMTGAKSAMEAALRRIDLLEMTLKSVIRQSDVLSEAFGEKVQLDIWHQGGEFKPVKVSKLFEKIRNDIKAVL